MGNNQAEDVDAISTLPPTVDLVVKKDNGQTIATPGQTVSYQITVINKSTVGIDSIKLLDVVPPDFLNAQFFATSGDYDPMTGLWTNIYLAPNGDENTPANTPDSIVKLLLEGTVQSPPTQVKLTNTATVEAPADLKPLEISLGGNISTYLQGAIDGGKVQMGDAIEYTIYYLNAGAANANNLKICDRITPNQSFKPNGYALGLGIQFQIGNSSVMNLTNSPDSIDRGQFIAPLAAVPTSCSISGANTDGTIAVDITGATNPVLVALPGSTGSGTPTESYGLMRFTTIVK